jgi:hypothetical protein
VALVKPVKKQKSEPSEKNEPHSITIVLKKRKMPKLHDLIFLVMISRSMLERVRLIQYWVVILRSIDSSLYSIEKPRITLALSEILVSGRLQ